MRKLLRFIRQLFSEPETERTEDNAAEWWA